MKKRLEALKKTESKGNTLIELIIVMSMVALLGGTLVSLISTGGNSFQKINSNYKAENEARIAMSYVTVKIRQNDIKNAITVLSADSLKILNPDTALGKYWKIHKSTSPTNTFQLVEDVYDSSNNLLQSSVIAEDIEFSVSYSGNKQILVTIEYLGSSKKLEETITLRTD